MDSDDLFDRLPDEVVRIIFSKLKDARSLCSSMSVCKRFHYIVPQVDDVFISIPQKKESDQETHRGFKNLVLKTLLKPFQFISQMIKFKSKNQENDLDFYSNYVPNEILKSFQGVRSIQLRLPCHVYHKSKRGLKNTTFLKWKAEFGRELHSCVILGAKSWPRKRQTEEKIEFNDQESRVMSDEELKLRIVWTISCLIAASARHYLIKETVKAQKGLQELVVSDESDQGRLCMNREQIEEMRELKEKSDEMLEYRSRVPALRMKMWYLEKLELPDSGGVMEGATVVVIRPAATGAGGGDGEGIRSDGDVVAAAFQGEGERKVLCEAVRKLMVAKKCYTLEMNSF
ncbi:hypothetical protein CDL12_09929 [Handroanthus impetiginosus]|uniref:F-box domain-containing protein n=1 Tax=Handroanthus impetiginosus TaxID=429701 RepID=A0A2G9HIZ8_9LAMI|nr:hypothetical protein CDL12_09929 [Handroanthus impetiginosus]